MSEKLPRLTAKEAEKILLDAGFKIDRQNKKRGQQKTK